MNCIAISSVLTFELMFLQEIFEGLRKCDDLTNNQVAVSLDDKDLEYLEAACLLHNIGISVGKKGYHKHSYSIIMVILFSN